MKQSEESFEVVGDTDDVIFAIFYSISHPLRISGADGVRSFLIILA